MFFNKAFCYDLSFVVWVFLFSIPVIVTFSSGDFSFLQGHVILELIALAVSVAYEFTLGRDLDLVVKPFLFSLPSPIAFILR